MQPSDAAASMVCAPGTALYKRLMGSGVWVAQEKLDGCRAIYIKGKFWSRHGNLLTATYQPTIRAKAAAGLDAVIDGESVKMGSERLFVAFDLIELNGEDLRHRPWSERWMRLQNLGIPTVTTNVDNKEAFWEHCMGQGAEGIVLKHMRDPYPPIDGAVWYKVKP